MTALLCKEKREGKEEEFGGEEDKRQEERQVVGWNKMEVEQT